MLRMFQAQNMKKNWNIRLGFSLGSKIRHSSKKKEVLATFFEQLAYLHKRQSLKN